jgi:outer membrane protein
MNRLPDRLPGRPPGRLPAPLFVRALRHPRAVALAVAALLLPAASAAAGLGEIYQMARDNDAQIAAARQAALAGQERAVQGRAGLLPNVGLSGYVRENTLRSALDPDRDRYQSSTIALELTQPILRLANWRGYEQGQLQARLAEQQLQLAEQQLRLRVSQAYFEVLQAEDALATLGGQKEAFGQQLAQAKRAYDVGLSPITDVTEAQSRFDLTVAQEIAARNELEIKSSTLEKSIGRALPPLDGLDPAATVDDLSLEQLTQLRDGAAITSLQVAASMTAEQIAQAEVAKQSAGHVPTVDLVAAAARNKNTGSGAFGDTDPYPKSIGLELNIPIYEGGAVSSRTREAAANLGRAQSELEETRRQARLDARQAMLGVLSGSALTRALQQALSSSETQVRATQRGFEVGVRTRIDVLNAEQQLFTTRRDLSAARYQTLVSTLQLRAAAGVLTEDDLRLLDRLLEPR